MKFKNNYYWDLLCNCGGIDGGLHRRMAQWQDWPKL